MSVVPQVTASSASPAGGAVAELWGEGGKVLELLTTPEVMAAAVGVLVPLLGVVAVRLQMMQRNLKEQLTTIHDDVSATKHQVKNSHKTNFREDVDVLSEQVAALTATVEQQGAQMRQRFDEVAAEMARESMDREARDRRSEAQIDGLRDDVRGTQEALRNLSATAWADHQTLHDRITTMKDQIRSGAAGYSAPSAPGWEAVAVPTQAVSPGRARHRA
jgi:hypothetical protein|nr:MAG TPA: Protein of unknown function (DUF2746) [Caudoviricetes sp.]